LDGNYYVVQYSSEKNRFLIINANSAFENSLYLIADTGSVETAAVSLGFDNKQATTGSSSVGNVGTPLPSSGTAQPTDPFTAQFKDLTIKLSDFKTLSGDIWQTEINLPNSYIYLSLSTPVYLNLTINDYNILLNTLSNPDTVFVKITYIPTGEVAKGTVTQGEGGALYYYPPGKDPKIYEYDSEDKKSYEVSLSSVNTYQIQVASSEDTLQKSIENIETYIAKFAICRFKSLFSMAP